MKRDLTLALFALMTFQAAVAGGIEVVRHKEADSQDTLYLVNQSGCAIGWRVGKADFGHGLYIRDESKCDLSLEKQVPLRAAILRQVLVDNRKSPAIRTFFWGRLERGDANDEYGKRFSRVVGQLPESQWDSHHGRLVGKAYSYYDFLQDLLNQKAVFSELVTVFAGEKLVLKVTDIEKIRVQQMEVKDGAVTKYGTYPFDAVLSFSVTRAR